MGRGGLPECSPPSPRRARPPARPHPTSRAPSRCARRWPGWPRPRPPAAAAGLARGVAPSAGASGAGGLVERGIQPHARDAREGRRHRLSRHRQVIRRPARGAQHAWALGHPAPHHQEHVPGPGRQLLVLVATCPLVGLGRGQHRQAGPGPAPLAPGMGTTRIRRNQRNPLALTKRGRSAPARDPSREPGFRAPAALQGVVHAHAPWTGGGQGVSPPVQEQTRSLHARPDGAVQDAMRRLKGLRMRQAHHPQAAVTVR